VKLEHYDAARVAAILVVISMADGRPGRRSQCTPELTEKFCEVIRAGNYMETAARVCGVPEDLVRVWMHRGGKQASGKFHDFANAVGQALAESEMGMVQIIQGQAKASWKAAAWYLERRFSERWGKKESVNVNGHIDGLTGDGGFLTTVADNPDALQAAEDFLRAVRTRRNPNGESNTGQLCVDGEQREMDSV
jgi:hypothetical protein